MDRKIEILSKYISGLNQLLYENVIIANQSAVFNDIVIQFNFMYSLSLRKVTMVIKLVALFSLPLEDIESIIRLTMLSKCPFH